MNFSFNKIDVLSNKIPDNIIGVYYFLDANKSIIYIGKSVDVKKRLSQHIYKGRKRLIDSFRSVQIQVLDSELEALLFESQEIKKYRPIFNRRLRRSKTSISLYKSTDNCGYHFYFLSHKKLDNELIEFMSKKKAERFILKLTQNHNLCEKINGLDHSSKSCFQYQLNNCKGACIKQEMTISYNNRFNLSLNQILRHPIDCKLIFPNTSSFVIIRNNRVSEYGVIGKSHRYINFPSYDELKIVNTFKNKLKKSSANYRVEYI